LDNKDVGLHFWGDFLAISSGHPGRDENRLREMLVRSRAQKVKERHSNVGSRRKGGNGRPAVKRIQGSDVALLVVWGRSVLAELSPYEKKRRKKWSSRRLQEDKHAQVASRSGVVFILKK
jgi:hypothetical protein